MIFGRAPHNGRHSDNRIFGRASVFAKGPFHEVDRDPRSLFGSERARADVRCMPVS